MFENMNDYYIKFITGPGGRMGYPENNGNLVAFAPRQEKPCNRFKECNEFLLYETGHKDKNGIGAKAIYARGVIDADQSSFIHLPGFGEEIVGKKLRRQRGGLLRITKEQFNALSSELNK